MKNLLALSLALSLVFSGSVFGAEVISTGTIVHAKSSTEALKVLVHSDGSVKLQHQVNGVVEDIPGFQGLNQTTINMMAGLANRRNLMRLLGPLPLAACASALVGYAGVHLGIAMHPNQGFATLIYAIYLYGPAGLGIGATAGYLVPVLSMSARKKQRQAIRTLAKASTTVVGAVAISPMPIPELIANLLQLDQIARR